MGAAMRIIIDTREQCPFPFAGKYYEDVEVERGALPTGDYSLAGLVDRIAIERKSLDDLLGCLTKHRARFEAELNRARGLSLFAVVVEAGWADLAQGAYRSRMQPHAACQSVTSFMVKYGVPFLFAGSRAAAEYLCWSILHQFLDGTAKRYREIIRAHGECGLSA